MICASNCTLEPERASPQVKILVGPISAAVAAMGTLVFHALATDPDLVAVGSHVRLFPRDHLKPGRLAYEDWLNSLDGPEAIGKLHGLWF